MLRRKNESRKKKVWQTRNKGQGLSSLAGGGVCVSVLECVSVSELCLGGE